VALLTEYTIPFTAVPAHHSTPGQAHPELARYWILTFPGPDTQVLGCTYLDWRRTGRNLRNCRIGSMVKVLL